MLGPFLRRSVSYGRRSLSSGGSTSPICLTRGEGTEGQLGHYPFETSGVMKQYVELDCTQWVLDCPRPTQWSWAARSGCLQN